MSSSAKWMKFWNPAAIRLKAHQSDCSSRGGESGGRVYFGLTDLITAASSEGIDAGTSGGS